MLVKTSVRANNLLVAGLATAFFPGNQPIESSTIHTTVDAVASTSDEQPLNFSGENIHIRKQVFVQGDEKWENKDVKRFKQLAVLRALGNATDEDNVEFSRLQIRRRKFENPLSAEQILAEMQRKEMLRDLEGFFRKYAASVP